MMGSSPVILPDPKCSTGLPEAAANALQKYGRQKLLGGLPVGARESCPRV